MIEQDIESAILAQLQKLAIPGLDIGGVWQSSASGTVANTETPASDAVLRLSVLPRSFETFSLPTADISARLVLAVRRELSAENAEFAAFAYPILDLLQSWQTSIEAVQNTFTLDNFTPCGFRIDGGDTDFDRDNFATILSVSFTIKGTIG